MIRRSYLCALVLALLYGSIMGGQQFPILDMVANKVIQKYQTSSCEQLWEKKAMKAPPTQREQEAIQMLHENPQMRAEFINRVAAPVANKMFECGMIP
jgi:hypothetical protein